MVNSDPQPTNVFQPYVDFGTRNVINPHIIYPRNRRDSTAYPEWLASTGRMVGMRGVPVLKSRQDLSLRQNPRDRSGPLVL